MEYWYLWVVFAFLCVLTVFVMAKASTALKKHNSEKNNTLDQLKRLKVLKDEFINLSKEKAEDEESQRLLEGVMAVIQYEIEKSDDAEKLFESFSDMKKAVYTLNYIIEDSNHGLSNFFKKNGEPLISNTQKALLAIGETELSDIANEEFMMFDEYNENVSIDDEKIKDLDSRFLSIYDKAKLFDGIKDLIVQNIGAL